MEKAYELTSFEFLVVSIRSRRSHKPLPRSYIKNEILGKEGGRIQKNVMLFNCIGTCSIYHDQKSVKPSLTKELKDEHKQLRYVLMYSSYIY
jgi:hypothetical protein